MAVLEIVAASDEPMRFTDILRRSDQPRGTLHRQLSNLIEEGLLAVNRDHSYSLGIRLLKFASKAWAGNEFRTIAEPHLRRLHEQTGETVHLGVLRGLDVIYLDKVESRQAVRMYSQIGNASPVYCTGVGKAALSCLPQAELDRLLPRIVFHRYTEHTLMSSRRCRRNWPRSGARAMPMTARSTRPASAASLRRSIRPTAPSLPASRSPHPPTASATRRWRAGPGSCARRRT